MKQGVVGELTDTLCTHGVRIFFQHNVAQLLSRRSIRISVSQRLGVDADVGDVINSTYRDAVRVARPHGFAKEIQTLLLSVRVDQALSRLPSKFAEPHLGLDSDCLCPRNLAFDRISC
jgi:hypothetical protein